MKVPKGYVIYEGKSQIDGQPIIGVITLASNNIKTGNMPSLWILHKTLSPLEASKTGKDTAVCGDCPMRHFKGGACYVTIFQAPLQVWKSYKKGQYPKLETFEVFEGSKMRFGAYGDPLALPVDILVRLKAVVSNNTSYTHQWRKNNIEAVKKLSMASVDNISEAKLAQALGWRTFRVTKNQNDLLPNEIICPNYTSGIKCIDCNLCKGTSTKAKSIVIPIHGAKIGRFIEYTFERYNETINRVKQNILDMELV